MVTTMETYQVAGHSVAGCTHKLMRAANRNLTWRDMACEFVDNGLGNHKPNEPCVVELLWVTVTSGAKSFTATDRGIGCGEPARFLRPGLGGNNMSDLGTSTFGLGLYACEAHLQGEMVIASEHGGTIRRITRKILESEDGVCREYDASPHWRTAYGLSKGGGTTVTFTGYRKRGPGKEELAKIVTHLGECYATAIQSGALKLYVSLNGTRKTVKAKGRPEVERLFTASEKISGHVYDIEWGVTLGSNNDKGVRLVYGGKQIDTAPEACGEYSVGRFYASIRIPMSAGRDSVDLLKRTVDRDFFQDVFDLCYGRFAPQLKESDRLSRTDSDRKANDAISSLLSKPKRKKKPETTGTEDVREFLGRDPAGKGVKPQGTGRRRQGRCGKGDPGDVPPTVTIDWLNGGLDKPMATYDVRSERLTYNTAYPLVTAWREAEAHLPLAQLGAAFMAKTISVTDPRNADQLPLLYAEELGRPFEEVYRDIVTRMYQAV